MEPCILLHWTIPEALNRGNIWMFLSLRFFLWQVVQFSSSSGPLWTVSACQRRSWEAEQPRRHGTQSLLRLDYSDSCLCSQDIKERSQVIEHDLSDSLAHPLCFATVAVLQLHVLYTMYTAPSLLCLQQWLAATTPWPQATTTQQQRQGGQGTTTQPQRQGGQGFTWWQPRGEWRPPRDSEVLVKAEDWRPNKREERKSCACKSSDLNHIYVLAELTLLHLHHSAPDFHKSYHQTSKDTQYISISYLYIHIVSDQVMDSFHISMDSFWGCCGHNK